MNAFFKDSATIERMKLGPLGCFLPDLAKQLQAQGYANKSIRRKLQRAACFSRWLDRNRIPGHQVTPQGGMDFLRSRKRAGFAPHPGDRAAVVHVLKLLCDRKVIPKPATQPNLTPSEELLSEYDLYLQKERSLTLATPINYRPFVRQFLVERFNNGRVDLGALRAIDVIAFVQRKAGEIKSIRVQLMTTALRSFLRFVRYRGKITLDLAACVPAVANWSLSTLPKSLPPAHVEGVLAHLKQPTALGRRDYAILLLLARLGLRSGEIAHLTLEDMDWERGCITIRGKMGRVDQLPLPADVAEALVAYLKDGRPRVSADRHLFLGARAPLSGFRGPQAVGSVVKHWLARAGIDSPRKGAHQFRHSLASEMLRRGHSLREIGEVLRHRSPQTTAIYAKVDLHSLRSLALPWPGGER